MKKAISIILIFLMSCVVSKKSSVYVEDELFITKKYAGNFLYYNNIQKQRRGDPSLIYITTTLTDTNGLILLYAKECRFVQGERLYIRREYQTTTAWSSWVYMVENLEETVKYKVCQLNYGNKVLEQSWY